MRKVREVLRLKHGLGLSERQIAASVGVSRSTVAHYLRRAGAAGITWPVPEGMYDAELERRLFTLPSSEPKPTRWLPDWHHVHKELKRHGVTLLLLWEEYRAQHVGGVKRPNQFNVRVSDATKALADELIKQLAARDKRAWSQADLVEHATAVLAQTQQKAMK
jgi:transposase